MPLLIPARRYRLRSPHAPDRCCALLREALDRSTRRRDPASVEPRPPLGAWPLAGSADRLEFAVQRLSTDPTRPVARGRLLPAGAGTELHLSVAPGRWAWLRLAVPVAVFLMLSGGLLAGAARNGGLSGPDWPLVLLSLAVGALLGGPVLAHTVWRIRRAFAEDEPALLGFLRSTLDLAPSPEDRPA